MIRQFEVWYEPDQILLIADVSEVDASFTHEFGFEKRWAPEIVSFNVIVFIIGCNYDLTEYFNEKHPRVFEGMREFMLNHAAEAFAQDRIESDDT